MNIIQKIKCTSCGDIIAVIEGSSIECSCGKVVLVEGSIRGNKGFDYIDVTPKLLNENKNG